MHDSMPSTIQDDSQKMMCETDNSENVENVQRPESLPQHFVKKKNIDKNGFLQKKNKIK